MAKFDYDKKGYNIAQVDSYIAKLCLGYENKLSEQKNRIAVLKNENRFMEEKLRESKEKDAQISKALVLAVEKAEQYEKSKRKIYDLEIKRVRILYDRIFALLNGIMQEYPETENSENIYSEIAYLKECVESIQNSNNKLDEASLKENLKKSNLAYIKNILNKMDYMVHGEESDEDETFKPKKLNNKTDSLNLSESISKPKEKIVATTHKKEYDNISEFVEVHNKENNRMANIREKLTSSIEKNKAKNNNSNLADDFLNGEGSDEIFGNSAYAKRIVRKRKTAEDVNPFNFSFPEPNESGFDLKEALFPKDDLDTIMQAFDFSNTK